MPPVGILTRNPSKRAATGLRLRPRDHLDRHGIDPRAVRPVATRYTGYTIPPHEYSRTNIKQHLNFKAKTFSIICIEETTVTFSHSSSCLQAKSV